jgi:hypothetical protein
MSKKALGYTALRDSGGFQMTRKGVKVELKMYVYPDDHGNLFIKGGEEAPFAYPEEAVAAFLAVLTGARKTARGDGLRGGAAVAPGGPPARRASN